jgi:ElaA protein
MAFEWQMLHFENLSTEQLYKALQLRQRVFAVEQDCAYLDLDGRDLEAFHMLCLESAEIKAYQRCLPPGTAYPESSMGRIVVDPELRGQQLGRELVQRGIDFNLANWPSDDICISAQAHLQPFYASLGFQSEGEEYMEDNIPHCKMRYSAARP